VGETFRSRALAERLNRLADLLRAGQGGVTFSGGEPLGQALFLAEVIEQLDRVHVVLDTSGYASGSDFELVVSKVQLVYFDLKLMNPEEHVRHTGVSNEPILANLRRLSELAVPYVVRVPLVPGVTDTDENLLAIAGFLQGRPGLQTVHLLPYNAAAGAKYAACGLHFGPTFDPARPVNRNTACFAAAGLEAHVL
jgi:pyruvate formate lyase activating enzyme